MPDRRIFQRKNRADSHTLLLIRYICDAALLRSVDYAGMWSLRAKDAKVLSPRDNVRCIYNGAASRARYRRFYTRALYISTSEKKEQTKKGKPRRENFCPQERLQAAAAAHAK